LLIQHTGINRWMSWQCIFAGLLLTLGNVIILLAATIIVLSAITASSRFWERLDVNPRK